MRKLMVESAGLFLIPAFLAAVEPEEPGSIPPLEEMLERALKENPDILLARAKLRRAEEALNRTRLEVAQKVIAFRHSMEAQKLSIEEAQDKLAFAETRLDATSKRAQTGTASRDEALVAEQEAREAKRALIRAKAKLAEMEATVPYILGKQARAEASPGPAVPPAGGVRDPRADKLRRALDTPITASFEKSPLVDVLKHFEDVLGINFLLSTDINGAELALTLHLKDVPFRAALEAVGDQIRNIQFVARQYGILVTEAVPEGAILLKDY